jgi:NADPH2:quinone reductase
MRALVADPLAASTMRVAQVDEPVPGADYVVVEVHHASLNHGDLNDAVSGRVAPGRVLGSDVAGVVVRGSDDGSGPGVGKRVVALAEGAFAERVAIPSQSVAEIPDGLDLSAAAGLPVAGLAALRSLRASGSLLGRRVLITGAGGGVGTFAIQLAAAAGAFPIAATGTLGRAGYLRDLGAKQVVTDLDEIDAPIDVVIDSVGGPQLVRAWDLLAPGGCIQSVGWTSGTPAEFPPYATIGPPKSLNAYLTLGAAGGDLAVLARLAATGRLDVPIGWRGSWDGFADAVAALRGRRVQGKAILEIAASGAMA